METFVDLGFGIAEVGDNGDCIVTKYVYYIHSYWHYTSILPLIRHEALNGIVNEDTVRSQLLYELQGNIYLNNDVKADLANVKVNEVSVNR